MLNPPFYFILYFFLLRICTVLSDKTLGKTNKKAKKKKMISKNKKTSTKVEQIG